MVAFEIVMAVVCAASAVVASVMFVRAIRLYDKIGALGTLGMSHDDGQAVARREIVREEVRQMVDAISALREERGSRRSRRTCCVSSRRTPRAARRAIAAEVGHVAPTSTTSVELLTDPVGACAELLTAAAGAGGAIVLACGGTPGSAYERAAREPAVWPGATVWFGDERCVAPKDVRSDQMVQSALLCRLDDDSWPDVQRIRAELGVHDAVADYERRPRSAGPPRFDLVLLGVGTDGHTASLFPDQDALEERERLMVGVERPGRAPFVPRVTLTLPALTAARRVVFLVTGAEKAGAVAAAFGPAARPDRHVPASMVAAASGEVIVPLDAAAASRL